MKKPTLAILAFAIPGIAVMPTSAQNDGTIIENTQENIITGNDNNIYNTSIQENQETNRNAGNISTVIRNSQVCYIQGDGNSCINISVQQN